MKKLLSILFIFFYLKSISQTFPITQNIGSKTTIVNTAGTFGSQTGFLYHSYTDTTEANTVSYLKFTAGEVILTSYQTLWVRNSAASAWVQISGSGSGSTLTSLGSGFVVGVNGTNNVKSILASNGLTPDSSIAGSVRIRLGGSMTGITSLTGNASPASNRLTLSDLNFFVTWPGTGLANQLQITSGLSRISSGNNAYSDYSGGSAYTLAVDSVQWGIGSSNPSLAIGYLKLYPHLLYGFTDSAIVFSSHSADQYARDSLIWRMTDRSSHFFLSTGFGATYAEDSLLFDSETSGYYRFTHMASTTDTTTYKPVVMDVNGKIKIGNSWAQFAKNIYNSDGILTGNRTLTGNNSNYSLTVDSMARVTFQNLIGDFTVTSTSGNISLEGSNNASLTSANGVSLVAQHTVNITAVDSMVFTSSGAGYYRFVSIPYGSIDTTTNKPLAANVDGKMVRMNSWAQVSGGSASVTWNGISNPTGDQALTFDAGESSTWTNSNTTEDLLTVNSSTITTSSLFSLNSTSTALAAGNNLMELVMSGANGTNAITATALRIAVSNTNATSGTNIGIDASASGATTKNISVWARERIEIGSPTTSNNYALNIQSLTNTANEGIIVFANNLTASMKIGYQTLQTTGAMVLAPQSTGTEINSKLYVGAATSPTATIHVLAGTTAASSAPLKFTTGTSMTTAEAGAFEYTTPALFFTNGGAQRQEIPQIQQTRVSTQFDKTSSTALANITGLTATLVAGKIYRFEANLYTTSNSGGGVQFAIGGTATATTIIYEGLTTDAGLTTQGRGTALATSVGAVTAVTAAYCRITGLIVCNAAGTLTVQFAQNASNGTASSVLVGSHFVTTEMQ